MFAEVVPWRRFRSIEECFGRLLVVERSDNKAIADELGISASTVRVLIRRAVVKTGSRSRRELLHRVRGAMAIPR
jgi:FixJ family two-component response regulator